MQGLFVFVFLTFNRMLAQITGNVGKNKDI